jgi:hypothetical protein
MSTMEQDYESFDPEFEAQDADEFEFAEENEMEEMMNGETESQFSEDEEFELAAELLSVESEEELDLFLGKLFKKIGRGIKKGFRPLGRILKSVAKKALPFLGGALGSFIPIPGVGTAIGSAVGGALSKTFELEFEGVEPEEQELEMARRFVRLAGNAAQQAAMAPASVDPAAAATAAVKSAARTVGSAVSGAVAASSGTRRSGRWIRRGRRIIILGV